MLATVRALGLTTRGGSDAYASGVAPGGEAGPSVDAARSAGPFGPSAGTAESLGALPAGMPAAAAGDGPVTAEEVAAADAELAEAEAELAAAEAELAAVEAAAAAAAAQCPEVDVVGTAAVGLDTAGASSESDCCAYHDLSVPLEIVASRLHNFQAKGAARDRTPTLSSRAHRARSHPPACPPAALPTARPPGLPGTVESSDAFHRQQRQRLLQANFIVRRPAPQASARVWASRCHCPSALLGHPRPLARPHPPSRRPRARLSDRVWSAPRAGRAPRRDVRGDARRVHASGGRVGRAR